MKAETEYTPGPWNTDYRQTLNGYAQEIFDANGKVIARCAWYPVKVSETCTGTNRAANAQLIAAAPELLEALQELRYASTDKAERMADAAIAKALIPMTANARNEPRP